MSPGYLDTDGYYDKDGVYHMNGRSDGVREYTYTPKTGSWFRGWGMGISQEIDALRKVASSLSESYDIKIVIREYEDAVAHVDKKTNTLTLGTKGIYTNGSDYYVGLLLHEIAHIRHSPQSDDGVKKRVNEFKNPHIAKQMWNMLEDKRIDERMKDDYSGAATYYDSLYTPLLDEVVRAMEGSTYGEDKKMFIDDYVRTKVDALTQERNSEKAFADDKEIQEFQAKARNEVKEGLLFRCIGLGAMEVAGRVDAQSTTGVKEVDTMATEVANLLREAADSRLEDKQVTDLTMETLRVLDPLIPDKEYSDEKNKGQGDGEGEGEGSAGGGVSHGEGAGHSGHGHNVADMFSMMGGGHKTTASAHTVRHRGENSYTKANARIDSLAGVLKRKLVGVLRENERAKYLGGQRRGLLNKRALNRTARGNYRIYRKRFEPKGLKYAVAIVEDCSGSMWSGAHTRDKETGRVLGSSARAKFEYAHEMVALFARVFRTLGFPVGISIYGALGKTVLNPKDRYVVQQVNDRMEQSDGYYYHSGSNETHVGIKNAMEYLNRAGAGRQKLLIVITDGGLDSSDVEESRAILKKAMKHGDFWPMLYYVEDGTRRILNDPEYEAFITEPSTQLVEEAVRLMKKVVPPMQEID